MNKFVSAIGNARTTTTNGMAALESTGNAAVEYFYKAGALRANPAEAVRLFKAAYAADRDTALRLALWTRDVRGGAGERNIFRSIIQWLQEVNEDDAAALLVRAPIVGRWDDVLVANDRMRDAIVYPLLAKALMSDGIMFNETPLVAKWMPRKGLDAYKLRKAFGLSPKAYRKLLVKFTNVVESLMCAKEFDKIDYSTVPSVALSRLKKAFSKRDTERFVAFMTKAVKGEVKVNASAIFPYQVLGNVHDVRGLGDRNAIIAQWNNLPNYTTDKAILPLVDVSGSMTSSVSGRTTALDVAVSLGLYLSEKNSGPYKDCFLTFSGKPKLLKLKGDIVSRVEQMVSSDWEMNTNLEAAFKLILKTAIDNDVPADQMPAVLLILSDMQFDQAIRGRTATETIKALYGNAGYTVPQVVFWNINSHDNVPSKFNEQDVALVSGFSPAIVKSILTAKNVSPVDVMMDAIGIEKYDPTLTVPLSRPQTYEEVDGSMCLWVHGCQRSRPIRRSRR